jgi:S-methylmethionine-dependent homocysteine/selenocysteine methylase
MSKYRAALPQLADTLFLTDGGLETTLVFHDGIDLPCFAAFDLMKSEAGAARLRDYFVQYATTAREAGLGFVFESATWRASPDWGAKLGHTPAALADLNRRAVAQLAELRERLETAASPMVISGNIGPRGDGYVPGRTMSADAAEGYHAWQVGIFCDSEADMVSAFTINYVEEAIGIARAARAASMPVVISFTLETDGRLPTGETLREAIEEVDAETESAPAYFMINCAHPTHFEAVLQAGQPWVERIRGLRANASRRSHAELDQAKDLDAGDPSELATQYRDLRRRFPQLAVLGGCCGTDHRHLDAICRSCAGDYGVHAVFAA